MSVLCYDISSGGITAALFKSDLKTIHVVKSEWTPGPTLKLETIAIQFKRLTAELAASSAADPVKTVSIGSFLHSFVLLDQAGMPLTDVFTWLDVPGNEADDGVERVRSRIGDSFHQRTGCRYHPMFPVFKLVALHLHHESLLAHATRIVSAKSFFVHRLTGTWIEDHGTASATGLYNIPKGNWDSELMDLAGIDNEQLAPVAARGRLVGHLSAHAAREFGLAQDVNVVNGSGDGFLADIGSECESPQRISVTLGTSGAARQTISRPVLDALSGTFCYQAADDVYLLGCAGSNGGNVLEWSRSIFGSSKDADSTGDDVPVFIPLLNGERSPEWNPQLTGSWHGLKARHTAADLARSALEGVVFNLAYYVDILQKTSGIKAREVILSGNGFLDPLAAPILATVLDAAVLIPGDPGLASLRGSAICALRTAGTAIPPLELKAIAPISNTRIRERYRLWVSCRRGL